MTETAEIIRAVWCDVLEIDKVDEGDDFFEVGGHSLTAMQVARQLRAKLGGVKVPTRLLFTNPTFATFVGAVEQRLAEAPEQVAPV